MAFEITPKEAKTALEEGKAVLLDVRYREEIEFSAVKPLIWIELTELSKRFTELAKDKEIICICRTGSRSASAAEFLREKGFSAKNLHGGIFEWSKIDPSLKKYVYFWEEEKLVVEEI